MAYLEHLPKELLHDILYYMDYISIFLTGHIKKWKIDFESLLINKYLGFYKIFKFIKDLEDEYTHYTYQRVYEIINMCEMDISHKINKLTFRDTDPKKFIEDRSMIHRIHN